MDQHTYLMSLQERNERLFYYVLSQVGLGGWLTGARLGWAGCGSCAHSRLLLGILWAMLVALCVSWMP